MTDTPPPATPPGAAPPTPDPAALGPAEAVRLRDDALAAVPHAVVVTDPARPDNPIVYASPGFERLTGYPAAAAVGRSWEFLHGADTDPAVVADLRRAVADGHPAAVELVHYRADGSPFWNAVAVTPVRDGGRVVRWVGVMTDATGRHEQEAERRRGRRLEAVGRLVGGVAHDFNNLLTVITGYAHILLEPDPPAAQAHAALAAIRDAGDRAAGLTRQLLLFGRPPPPRPGPLDLNAVVADLGGLFGRLLGEDVALVLDLQPDLGAVRVAPTDLEQILLNLIANARDAMPRGGRLRIETADVWHPAGGWPEPFVRVSVADTGVGMADEVKARLFEPFFTTKGEGSGYGLAVVREAVGRAGGHVEVDSRAGGGTTFRVYLPRAAAGAPDPVPAGVGA